MEDRGQATLATGARRVLLALAAVVFTAVALGSLVAPRKMAEPFDYALATANALNEYRAVYVGLWLAQAVVFAWAAWRVDRREIGDIAGILLLGQVAGRVASLVLDGPPDVRLLPMAAAELVAGVLILVLRPRRPAG